MNDSTYRNEIVRLEAQAEELADRIESCRKFILAGWVAIVTGGFVLLATVFSLIGSGPGVLGAAGAAVLGGIVAAGSNRSTAKSDYGIRGNRGEAGRIYQPARSSGRIRPRPKSVISQRGTRCSPNNLSSALLLHRLRVLATRAVEDCRTDDSL